MHARALYIQLSYTEPDLGQNQSTMAARMMQLRRVISLLTRNQPQPSILKEPPFRQKLPSTSACFSSINEYYQRGLQTLTNSNNVADENNEHHEASNLKPTNDSSAVKHTATSNFKTSPRHDLAMIFTCKVCETRSVKTACRESYEKGTVVVRCGGCNNLHLIADHLGLFGEPGSIEDFLAARGEEAKKGSVDTLNLTLEDLAGKEVLKD